MNSKLVNIILIIILLPFYSLQAQNTTPFVQKNGISCLGNGKMCVYEDHGNIIQLFGPPYSTSSVLQLTLSDNTLPTSDRETGTAIWKHRLPQGEILDFVAGSAICFVRKIENKDTVRMRLQLAKGTEIVDNTPVYRTAYGCEKAILLTTPAGTYAYKVYPIPEAIYYQMIFKGNINITQADKDVWHIECLPGNSVINIVGGRSYPDCVLQTGQTFQTGEDALLHETRNYWHSFSEVHLAFSKTIPAEAPQRERLIRTIDDVAVMIKCQQAEEGSVLAGYNYHLGYVRDQYGVARGLVKMGHVREAKSILAFYWDVWRRRGRIHNAQGIGIDAFHVHENDEVEITGYLIIQAFDYLNTTSEQAFIKEIFPMLEWAWDCQVRNLHYDMLPFNGDETYIAGGMLPRTVMFDGSAEATLLFITGGKQLMNWAAKHKAMADHKIKDGKKLLQTVESRYMQHFVSGDKLLTNNPKRKNELIMPQFRHGVCESCIHVDWTQKTDNNRYLCAACFPYKHLPEISDTEYFLLSVSLIPHYIHSNVLPDGLMQKLVHDVITFYLNTGRFPSGPNGSRTVGYDYGLFLYALTKMNHPLKDQIYEQMLNVLDDTGSWVEYYQNGTSSGTLCRPWESAINIEAAIDYAMTFKPPLSK